MSTERVDHVGFILIFLVFAKVVGMIFLVLMTRNATPIVESFWERLYRVVVLR